MKIGEFASSNNISIDTVRHYVELGLLLPEKKGAQFTYDDRCRSDLSEIMELKGMGFTLNEIKSIFTFKRLGKLTSYRENPVYSDIFRNRLRQLATRLEELQKSRDRLESMLAGLDSENTGSCRHGFDFRKLGLFCCSGCGGELTLLDARITDNLISDARLGCECGMEYLIEDGILHPGKDRNEAYEPGSDKIADYIETTDKAYLQNVYRGLDWVRRKLSPENLSGKVVLELGSGYGFFLRYIYEDLPEDMVYIAVDHDIAMHRFLKSALEKTGIRKNIFFVCSDFLELPLKPGTADLVLDLSGTSNYSFEHQEFLPEKMQAYFKADAGLLGSYILFGNFAFDSFIRENLRNNFRLESIKRRLERIGFGIIDETVSDYVDKGGKYETYFKTGEKVNACALYAKRRG